MKASRIFVAIHPDGSFLTFGNKAAWISEAAAKLAMVNAIVDWDAKPAKGQTKFDTYLKPKGYKVEAITSIKDI